ncbi:MAG: multiheme c-type cytochrome [Verrucomicrobiota bacterium]
MRSQKRISCLAAHGLGAMLVLAGSILAAAAGPGGGKEPIFLGAQACGECHEGPKMGHQFSKWRLTSHAKAYAALALPESKEIARLSGITEEPHRARLCLGCHATAAEAEDWERDERFHLEDGLQCEACHGPGSEYASAEIMRDRTQAKARGLKIPSKDACMLCHRVKGSHDAVLKRKPFDLTAAWEVVAHPLPEAPPTAEAPSAAPNPFKFTGVMRCAECHAGPKSNFQFSHWRMSAHARAYAELATPKAFELAKAKGLEVEPQRASECLRCHATAHGAGVAAVEKGFDVRDGVQCESCHGPGSDYASEAVMLDKATARTRGLAPVDAKTCAPCHQNAHNAKFDYETAVKQIAHPRKQPDSAQSFEPSYKNPINLALSPDGSELWIACERAAAVAVVDTATRRQRLTIPVGGQPNDVCFAPDGRRAFVSNRLDDTISVVEVGSHTVIKTLDVGDEPHGLTVDASGRHLYVLNTSVDNISVIDIATLREVTRLSASRSPWSIALSPEGKQLLVTHALSRFIGDRAPALSEVTVIDTERAQVMTRLEVPAANLLQGICWHPSGDYALMTLLRTKNLVPMTRINHGWTISNGLGVIWRDGRIDQVLLDENNRCFPDPTDVAMTPDGRYALVTSSSSDRIAVVDLAKLIALLKTATEEERAHVIPNHTGKPSEYVVKHIATGAAPRGITCAADGRVAYVANMLDDSVTVVDLGRLEAAGRIDLGGAPGLSRHRRGEKLFHNASISFHRQFSCSTCHPDGHIDNIVYDIEDDGIGMGPIDNRTLRGINDTAPFKWTGINPSLKRQCGARLAVFITRLQPLDPEQLEDLHDYLCSIPRPPNRYRKLGEDLTEPQRRGKRIFERNARNDGSVIPVENRCTSCHPPPLFTDGKLHNVGTKFPYDRDGKFDPPHLQNIYDSAPYLHNGIARTLEEIWTVYNPYDKHGVSNDMTKDQLNDLVEYLKTL